MAEETSVLDYREPEWIAKKLRLDKNTVYKYLQDGLLPGVQLGRKWLISERLLAEFLERETRQQTERRSRTVPQTPRLQRAIGLAQKYAQRRGDDFTGTEHLLVGLMHEASNLAVVVLKNLGVDPARPQEIFEKLGPARGGKVRHSPLTDRAQAALQAAQQQATALGYGYIGCESLLLALFLDPDGFAIQVLEQLGISYDAVRAEVVRVVGTTKP